MKNEAWLDMFTLCLFILSVHGNVLNNSTTEPGTNEPFENENLLRLALEKHIQEGNHLLLSMGKYGFAWDNYWIWANIRYMTYKQNNRHYRIILIWPGRSNSFIHHTNHENVHFHSWIYIQENYASI